MNLREQLLLRAQRVISILRVDKMLRFGAGTYAFTDYFKGFERVEAVRSLFGEKTEEVLQNLRVVFTWTGGYMWVNNSNGHIMVSSRYLNNGDKVDIYLDIIHELVHVKQFLEGKELFDIHYGYTERPTEIQAYQLAIDEARRIGLSDDRICDYLKTEWMSDHNLQRLAKTLGVRCAKV